MPGPLSVYILLRYLLSSAHCIVGQTLSSVNLASLILARAGTAFWQDESFDHRVRDEAEWDRIVRYIEQNPVSAGLIANASE